MIKTVISATLALILCPAVFAQTEPVSAPAKKPHASASGAGSASPAPSGSPQNNTAEIPLAGLKNWDSRLETLSAAFTQEVNFTEAGLKQSVEGELKYSKPNFLRIEHFKPARQIVITDKRDIWIYKPEDAQVIKTSWEAWRKTQNDSFSGILDFGNYSSLTENNNTSVSGRTSARPYITVIFTPKTNPEQYRLSLTLSATDYFPFEAQLTVDKTSVKTKLSEVKINQALPPELFKFSPPKGTQVLEFKN